MTYVEAISTYITSDGVATLTNPPEKTDNNVLFTATDLFVRRLLGLPVANRQQEVGKYLAKRSAVSANQYIPLPEKSWGGENLSHDEVNGLFYLLNQPAAGVVRRSAGPFFIFNATGRFIDSIRGCYLRFPYLVCYASAKSKNKSVGLFWSLLYALELWRTTRLSYQEPDINTSRRCLVLLQSRDTHRFNPIMRWAMLRFLRKTQEQFGSIGNLYGVYFGRSHPFSIYTRDIGFMGDKLE